jgi:hypothetical protein
MFAWRWLEMDTHIALLDVSGKWTVYEAAHAYENTLHMIATRGKPAALLIHIRTRHFPPDIIPGLRLLSRIQQSHHGYSLITTCYVVTSSTYLMGVARIYAALYGERDTFYYTSVDEVWGRRPTCQVAS